MEKGYSYNEHYLLKDGKPWFPVMGEMHYSRFRDDLWEESLHKMKAGGLDIVSTYVIWIHHEEEEGKFDFTGCRNLKKYVETCKKVGINVFLRIGPWCHGEVRNGGFPDWLLQKGINTRSNDAAYLMYARRYWEQVFEQVKGMMYKDGGPIIGIQIENEYGHVGGLRGDAGEDHMRMLTSIAKELGFDTPLYTATGWGGACIGDLLPVMGGYCEAPWDQSVEELKPNTNYVFSQIRNDSLIACDHHVEGAVTFDERKFPYLTAELGGGLQVTAHRRPVATGEDIGAMSLTKLGSGVGLLGYYMYHGGSNPEGKLSTLQESKATGYANDLPEINYDFNAPMRQYGTISDSYKEIKLLAYFLKEFGAELAVLREDILTKNSKPDDFDTLRLSSRHDGNHGYLFVNNYQRRYKMADHKDIVLYGPLDNGKVIFPKVTIASGEYAFFPYNMKLDNAVLVSALATPLCSLGVKNEKTYVFYGEHDPQFSWKDGVQARVLHLTRKDALNAWKVTLDEEHLILCDDYVWEENGQIRVTGKENTIIKCYPKIDDLEKNLPGFTEEGADGAFTIYHRKKKESGSKVETLQTSSDTESTTYSIQISYGEKENRLEGRDTLLILTYAGMSMDIYLGDRKINDHFYTGQQIPISLGYFDYPTKLTIKIHALHSDTPVFLEKWPEMSDNKACELLETTLVEQYR